MVFSIKLMVLAFRMIAFCLIPEVIELFINKLAVLNYFTLMYLFVKSLLYNRSESLGTMCEID